MIRRSTPLTEEIRRTTEIAGIAVSSPQIRRIRDPSDAHDAEKWCEIYRTVGHDLEECKKFLDHKKMPPPPAPAPQDPRRGEHHREDPNGNEHMAEINMIFGGSMSIDSMTQGKKLQREISMA
jgi:hypothetical protein